MPKLLKFNGNSQGYDYVVGDIHGMYDLLMGALDDLSFDKSKDRLFSVGDIIDRGPDSIKCLALCYEPWFHAVRGNHEQMAFDTILGFDSGGMWMGNGGAWYALNQSKEIEFTLMDLSERLPYGIEIDYGYKKVGIVHADVPFSDWDTAFISDGACIENEMLWSRRRHDRGFGHDVSGVDMVYVGHTPVNEPKTINNVKYIDVGSCFYNKIHIEKIN